MQKISKLLKTVVTYIRLDPELSDWYDQQSLKTGFSKSGLIYQAARRYRDYVEQMEKVEATITPAPSA